MFKFMLADVFIIALMCAASAACIYYAGLVGLIIFNIFIYCKIRDIRVMMMRMICGIK